MRSSKTQYVIFTTYRVNPIDQNMNYLSTTDFSRDELDRYITLVDNIKSTSDPIIEEEVHSQGYSTFVAGMSI